MSLPPSPVFSAASSTCSRSETCHRPLNGRLAIITGGSRGIGAGIARNLASKGASIVLNYNSEGSAKQSIELAQEIQDRYAVHCLPVKADMSDPLGATRLVNAVKDHFSHLSTSGSFQIDILINNAGVARNGLLGEISISDYEYVFRINVLGPLLLMQAVLPYLPHDRTGRIVNLSSISSSAGFSGQSVYGASKAALEGFTRSWARELAERGTVNAINPGPVKTDMWGGLTEGFRSSLNPWVTQAPMAAVRKDIDDADVLDGASVLGGRPAYASEIAGIVGMLCTDDSVWCTGQVICANGGMRMSA